MSEKFKILAADKLAEEGLEFIRSQPDAELTVKLGLSEDELAEIAGDYDGMIVRSGVQVTAKVLTSPGKLKAVARAGVGVDNIDLDAATSQGILVLNSAQASTISTAEHAFALMMAAARRIGPAHKTMAEGGWDRSKFVGAQLHGRTLGIIGFGRIGQAIAERALVFGMSVVAYDPFINASTMMDGKVRMFQDFRELLPHADVLTFHVPLTDETRGMLNQETFALCPKGVIVVNASRGGVVSEEALLEAVADGTCDAAGLDVYTSEPPESDSPLRNNPKIVTTPHLGASTKEGQLAVSVSAAESLLAYLRGEGIRGAINAGGFRVDLSPCQTRFVDLAKRMAALLGPLVTRGVANVKIEIAGKELEPAAGTIERSILVSLLSQHLDVPLNVINVSQIAKERGIQTRVACTNESRFAGSELIIEVEGPEGSTTQTTHPADRTRRIVGSVYDDLRPRIIEINGYPMDMIPAGGMLLIRNDDRPGMVGVIGQKLGEAGINIADMAISRRDTTALMVLKVDNKPSDDLLQSIRNSDGFLHVSSVTLAAE